jgi:VanZ family protein
MPRTLESLSSLWTMGLVVYWSALVIGTHAPLTPSQPDVSHFDKLLHFSAYGVLAVLAFCCLRSHRLVARICVLGLAVCLPIAAAIDEVTQIAVPGRDANLYDWIADVLGIACGLTLYVILLSRWRTATQSPSSPNVV